MLEAAGLTVVGEADDGRSALDMVGPLRPDLVLLDMHLPDANGVDLVAALRATGGHCEVVLISSRPLAGAGSCARRSGAAGFLAKEDLSGPALEELLGAVRG